MGQKDQKLTLETDMIPEWDLSDLYKGTDDPQIEKDLDRIDDIATDLRKKYHGRVDDLTAQEVEDAIDQLDKIVVLQYRIGCYTNMLQSIDTMDADAIRLSSRINERMSKSGVKYSFLERDLTKLSDEKLDEFAQSAERYEQIFADMKKSRQHMLDDTLEEFLIEQSPTGSGRNVTLYDMMMGKVRVPVDGKEYTLSTLSELLQSTDPKVREKAYFARSEALDKNKEEIAFIYNSLIKSKGFMDQKRGYARPISSQNASNDIEDDVIDTMVDVANQFMPEQQQRYNKLYAKWAGKKTLKPWDMMGPNPCAKEPDYIPWSEAVKIVKEAYREFDPEIADIVDQFFDNNWIHAKQMPNKESGAYCMPVSNDHHPYILMNYKGKPDCVTTLAHEIGHGVHMVLSNKNPQMVCNAPLTFAEVASVFGEMITFNKLVEAQSDPAVKRALLSEKVSDMLGTYGRQIEFHNFETRVHDAVLKNGELSADEIGEIWKEEASRYDGDTIESVGGSNAGWTRISHFFHVPFYVNSYAFADTTVNVLNSIYEESKEQGTQADFIEKYKQLLSEGGSKHHSKLLKPFNLKVTDPSYMKHEIKVISSLLDKLETLDAELDHKKQAKADVKKRQTPKRRTGLTRRLG